MYVYINQEKNVYININIYIFYSYTLIIIQIQFFIIQITMQNMTLYKTAQFT